MLDELLLILSNSPPTVKQLILPTVLYSQKITEENFIHHFLVVYPPFFSRFKASVNLLSKRYTLNGSASLVKDTPSNGPCTQPCYNGNESLCCTGQPRRVKPGQQLCTEPHLYFTVGKILVSELVSLVSALILQFSVSPVFLSLSLLHFPSSPCPFTQDMLGCAIYIVYPSVNNHIFSLKKGTTEG